MWNLVKGLSKIQYDLLYLFVSMIHNPTQLVADDVVLNLNQLGFTRPPTPETMLTVSKYDIQGLVFSLNVSER